MKLFGLAMDTILLLQYHILVRVDYLLAIINILYIFHDQSKIIIQYSKLGGIHDGVIFVKPTNPQFRTILTSIIN